MTETPPLICHRPWTSTFIRLDGAVTFCCHLPRPEAVIGNLRHQSFDAVWNSPLAREMRESFLRHRLHPLCRACPLSDVRRRAADSARWRPFGDEADTISGSGPLLDGEGRLFRLGLGWWDPEPAAQATLRWSQPRADIFVNRGLMEGWARRDRDCRAKSDGGGAGGAEGVPLILEFHATRGDGEPETRIRLGVEGGGESRLFRLPANRRSDVTFEIPAELLGGDGHRCPTIRLTLEVENPWVPRRCQQGSSDGRELGVILAGIGSETKTAGPGAGPAAGLRERLRGAWGRLTGRIR